MKQKNKFKLILLLILIALLINIKPILKNFYVLSYESEIITYSKEYNIDPYLVASIIKTESNFIKDAVSPKNAYGLMQVTEPTGAWIAGKIGIKEFTIDMLKDPSINIRMGCWYINDLSKEFNKYTDLVLAAYNGGRTNVKKWLSSKEYSEDGKSLFYIPFKETDEYVKKVKTNYKMYKWLYSLD